MRVFWAPQRHAHLLLVLFVTIGSGGWDAVHAQNAISSPTSQASEEFEQVSHQAMQGDSRAQFRLGQMYELGQGTAQSDSEAAGWYFKSAEQGYGKAQVRLGDLFKAGRGVARSDVEAVRWYRQAAQQGNASAQNSLAVMLHEGRGVAQNRQEARAWWQKAAEQGDPVAKVILAQLPPDAPASNKVAPNDTPIQRPNTASKLNERTTQIQVDPCEGFSNGTPVTVRLGGYPQAMGAMVLETSPGRATVQVMDMAAPPSVAGRRLDMACRSLIRAE